MRNLLRNIFLSSSGFFRKPKFGIHILNLHYVSKSTLNENKAIEIFENLLTTLKQNTKLIRIEDATNLIISKNIPYDEAYVALTFDDGFEECYKIIAPLLEKNNCNAAFFINSNSIESEGLYLSNFKKRINVFNKNQMTWDQIENLHKRGHIIGSHSLDHYNLPDLNINELEYQIKENKEILEKKLNYKCNYFAWPYGQLKNFTNRELNVAKRFHPFIFSGTNYKNYFSMENNVINRRHIEPFWPKEHINYFLSVNKLVK